MTSQEFGALITIHTIGAYIPDSSLCKAMQSEVLESLKEQGLIQIAATTKDRLGVYYQPTFKGIQIVNRFISLAELI